MGEELKKLFSNKPRVKSRLEPFILVNIKQIIKKGENHEMLENHFFDGFFMHASNKLCPAD